MIPAFVDRQKAWSSPPVDDIGYLPAAEMLALSDEDLGKVIYEMETNRYMGWRNYAGNWRRLLKMDETEGKRVLDYGCGTGLEALQYARTGNAVSLADIAAANIKLAKRVLALEGFRPERDFFLANQTPFFITHLTFDVVHCAGVLHHIPNASAVVEFLAQRLYRGGELRLMVYSDRAWEIATGTAPPSGAVEKDPSFKVFWTHWDPIGGYADWYDCAKLETMYGKWFDLVACEYLTEHGEYLGAVLRRKA